MTRHEEARCDKTKFTMSCAGADETDDSEVAQLPPNVSHFSCGVAATYDGARLGPEGPWSASHARWRLRVKVERPERSEDERP